MVQRESQLKKSNLFRRMLFYIIRICKLTENKTEDDSDDYMNLVDKLRERNLVPYQVPIHNSYARPHINQHMLPCEYIARETSFIGKDQENENNLKHPEGQVEYFVNWRNHLDLKHTYSAVNNKSCGMEQIDHNFKERKERDPDNTKISTRGKIYSGESDHHPHSVSARGNPHRKGLKTLSFSRSPASFGKHLKRYPFNLFSSSSQYHVLDAVADPLECKECGNHDNKSFTKAVSQDVNEAGQSGADLLGQGKQD